MSTKTHREDHEAVQVHIRPTRKRALPFVGSLLVAYVVLPLLYAASRATWLIDQPTGVMVADGWLIAGGAVAVVALGIGLIHAKRTTFVIKHVAATVFLVGLGGNLFGLLGFKHRLLDVASFFIIMITWGSWMLYRIDVFRAKATGQSADSWGDLIGLVKSRPKNVKVTDNQVAFVVEHGPGETHNDVKRGVEKAADAAGVITGRVRIAPGERGGETQVTWSTADVFTDDNWRKFPAPSHPGQSFAYPFRTAYYEDGEDEWFSFTPTFAELAASRISSLRSPMGTFLGFAGITGSGKSGFLNNVAAETLTRIDAVLVWVDAEKLFQNAGWCLDMCGLAAGNPEQVKILTRGLRGMAEYRVDLFGQMALDAVLDPSKPMQGREWSPSLARELHAPAYLVVVDEADTIIRTKAFEWLATRGRSLGIFLVPGGPRVSTAEVTALLRSAIGAWKTFGQGDAISGMFTLPDDVRETVDVQRLRAQGLHYMTGVPGVPRERWSVLAREYHSDTRWLREMVIAARSGRLVDPATGNRLCDPFEPMGISEEEAHWLGEAYTKLRPEVLMAVRAAGPTRSGEFDGDEEVPGVPEPANRPKKAADLEATQEVEAGYTDDDEDDPETGGKKAVKTSATGTVVDDDELAAMDNSAVDAEVARDAALVDLDKPFDTRVPDGEPVGVPTRKPQAQTEQEEQRHLDAVFRMFAEDETKRDNFGNQDVLDALQIHISAATMSRRMKELEHGARLMPPGLELERIEDTRRGRWRIVRTRPAPHRPGQNG
jgi:hypothetical protein